MRSRKIFIGLLFCLLSILMIGTISVSAASKKITMKPATQKEVHESMNVYFTINVKDDDIDKVEYRVGKTKKTANKYWKDTEKIRWLTYDPDTGKTSGSFFVYENGTYSIRITLTNGKKYVKSIKIKNMAPSCERSHYEARIKDTIGPTENGNYRITVDYFSLLTLDSSELLGKKVGDVISVPDRGKAKIAEIYTLDEEYSYTVKQNKVVEKSCVVMIPNDPDSFYDIKNSDDYDYYSDNSYKFAFIQDYEGGVFTACIAYNQPEEYRENMYNTVETGVVLMINKDTVICPSIYDHEKYGYDLYISFDKLMELSNDYDLQLNEGIYCNIMYFTCNIYEAYDKKTGKFTDYVSEIKEIYAP